MKNSIDGLEINPLLKDDDNFINISGTVLVNKWRDDYQEHKWKFYEDHWVLTVVDYDWKVYISYYTKKMSDFLQSHWYIISDRVFVPLAADEALRHSFVWEKFKELYEKASILPIAQQIYANLNDFEIKEHFLNKPNMTAKDKEWMEKTIEYLIDNQMNTQENFRKLDRIFYAKEYIEIWGVKRTREDVVAEPNWKNIFQYDDVIYFLSSRDDISQRNEMLMKQGMKIPSMEDCKKAIKALPKWDKENQWGNILGSILNMQMNWCKRSGDLWLYKKMGIYFVDNTENMNLYYGTTQYQFNDDAGACYHDTSHHKAMPIRPVYI